MKESFEEILFENPEIIKHPVMTSMAAMVSVALSRIDDGRISEAKAVLESISELMPNPDNKYIAAAENITWLGSMRDPLTMEVDVKPCLRCAR